MYETCVCRLFLFQILPYVFLSLLLHTCIWLLFYLGYCSWLMCRVSILCVGTMLNVVPATQTLRDRHFLAVDKNKPREAPARPANANSSSQGSALTGGNNQNQQHPPPDLVCLLLLLFCCALKMQTRLTASETITE